MIKDCQADGAANSVFKLMKGLSGLAYNVKAFVFVAEFEIRLPGTNADVKYKSSLLFLWLNL